MLKTVLESISQFSFIRKESLSYTLRPPHDTKLYRARVGKWEICLKLVLKKIARVPPTYMVSLLSHLLS